MNFVVTKNLVTFNESLSYELYKNNFLVKAYRLFGQNNYMFNNLAIKFI